MTRTSKSISHASFWKLVQGWLQSTVGTGSAYRGEIQVVSLLVLVLVAWCLLRWASHSHWSSQIQPAAGTHRSRGKPQHVGGGLEAPVVVAGLVVAYLFATPYILPWYDGLAFGVLALVAASAVDGFAVVHLLVLSLAYLPARVLPARVQGQPGDLDWLRTVVRPQMGWVLLVLTLGLVAWTWRAAGRERKRPTSTGPPPSAP
ncbi:hypothetical protein [Nonomuraea sp. KM90]|uniref:hypothetical protein n=1 Tax=Nonomuraea sp. KM90 TaxID=3457428 RepID=UPI003FCE8C59